MIHGVGQENVSEAALDNKLLFLLNKSKALQVDRI